MNSDFTRKYHINKKLPVIRRRITGIIFAVLLCFAAVLSLGAMSKSTASIPGAYEYESYNSSLSGWLEADGHSYYLNDDGSMLTGWQYLGGSWYCFEPDGAMITGWAVADDSWYYFSSNGKLLTGWQQIFGSWYYFGTDGVMQTDWVYSGGRWYYFGEDGKMAVGWQMIDGYWYYFEPENGYMTTDCWVTDYLGKACYINESGIWDTDELTWIGDSISTYTNGRSAINALFYNPDIESQASKCIYTDLPGNPSGLTIAGQMADEGRIHKYLVFQMGTNKDNDYSYISTVQKIYDLMNIVGSDVKIVLVTVYSTNDWCTNTYYGEINDDMRWLAAVYPNIAVADWAKICHPETDLLDYAHPSAYGGYKYMSLIRDTLVNSFGPQ